MIRLLQTDLNSDGVAGTFFTECLNHLAGLVSQNTKEGQKGDSNSDDQENAKARHYSNLKDLTLSKADDSKLSDNSQASSSVLLECEGLMPISLSELTDVASTLFITAALCEYMSEEVIEQAHLPSLLGACATILNSHARVLRAREEMGGVSVLQDDVGGEELVGGSVSLNLVFGLLSAVLSGARRVSQEVFFD